MARSTILQPGSRLAPTPATISRKPQLLFPGSWAGRAAEMIRIDLAARASNSATSSAGFLIFMLRGIPTSAAIPIATWRTKVAQELARHSDINLTMNTYTHLRPVDELQAVEAIPDPCAVLAQSRQRATGTDDRDVNPARGSVASLLRHQSPRTQFAKMRKDNASNEVSQNQRCSVAHDENDVSDHSANMENEKKPLQMQRLP